MVRFRSAHSRSLSIERHARHLLPWDDAAITRLSSRWRGRLVQSIGAVTAAGRCLPLDEGDGALMVFQLRRVRRKGTLHVWTSAQRIHVDLSGDVAVVAIDGGPVGGVHLRSGVLLDTGGGVVGSAARGRRVVLFAGPLRVGAGQREYVLIVRDRHIATLTTATDRATRRPLVVWVREDRDAEENAWLLVTCAMEAAYFGTLVARARRRQLKG